MASDPMTVTLSEAELTNLNLTDYINPGTIILDDEQFKILTDKICTKQLGFLGKAIQKEWCTDPNTGTPSKHGRTTVWSVGDPPKNEMINYDEALRIPVNDLTMKTSASAALAATQSEPGAASGGGKGRKKSKKKSKKKKSKKRKSKRRKTRRRR
jgi:hypothetical protein